jgi:hypothetical protein
MGAALDQTYFVQPPRRANKQGIPPRNPTHYAVYRKGGAEPVFIFSVGPRGCTAARQPMLRGPERWRAKAEFVLRKHATGGPSHPENVGLGSSFLEGRYQVARPTPLLRAG